jgi:hypothetical protein
VVECTAVPEAMRPRMREIVRFFVPVDDRRKRLGTMLLNMVCQEADANGITLLLTARAVGDDGELLHGPRDAQLVAFYERFGFVQLQDTPTGMLMARKVSEAPRVLAPHLPPRQLRAAVHGCIYPNGRPRSH